MGLKEKLIGIYERIYASDLVMSSLYRKAYKNERLNILDAEKTISEVLRRSCSVARFGDGEFELMIHSDMDLGFQKANPALAKKLRKTMASRNELLLLCIPHALNDISGRTRHSRSFWFHWGENRDQHSQIVSLIRKCQNNEYVFGDAQITRPYIAYRTPAHAAKIFPMLKKLWDGRDLLIVEGEKTRLGVGNDLFCNAISIHRILCPATNAFDRYDEILKAVQAQYAKGQLVLLALGPTATVLAGDLADAGIQAIDLGHIDIEYEWFLSGAKGHDAVAGKFTNECFEGHNAAECKDKTYATQIIAQILESDKR